MPPKVEALKLCFARVLVLDISSRIREILQSIWVEKFPAVPADTKAWGESKLKTL
jgi:hypothetical protein